MNALMVNWARISLSVYLLFPAEPARHLYFLIFLFNLTWIKLIKVYQKFLIAFPIIHIMVSLAPVWSPLFRTHFFPNSFLITHYLNKIVLYVNPKCFYTVWPHIPPKKNHLLQNLFSKNRFKQSLRFINNFYGFKKMYFTRKIIFPIRALLEWQGPHVAPLVRPGPCE